MVFCRAEPSGAGPPAITIPCAAKADVGMQTEAPDIVEVMQATFNADTASRTGRGSHLPLALRPHMTSFPRVRRLV